MKRVGLCVIVIFSLVGFMQTVAFSEVKKKVTLFPFNDLSASQLDLKSTAIIEAELSKNGFLSIMPAKVVRQKVLYYEPAFLWTGQASGQTTSQTTTQTGNQNTTQNTTRQSGGILWNIHPRIIERVARGLSSDYSIYGDISVNNKKWEATARLSDNHANVLRTFTATADSQDKLYGELTRMGRRISAFFEEFTVVARAEDEVRRYLAGFYSIETIIGKIQEMALLYPDALPLRAILLDLYLKDKTAFSERIRPTAERIISIYNPTNGDDTRYLLSLYLDPYGVLAEYFEAREEWARAIEIREKALQDFSFFADEQKKGLGHAAFMLAQEFEQRRNKARAAEYYRKALAVLPSGSDETLKSTERLREIGGQ